MILRLFAAALGVLVFAIPASSICWDIPPDPPPPPPPPKRPADVPDNPGPPKTPTPDLPDLPTTPRDSVQRPKNPRTATGGIGRGVATSGPKGPPVGESGWSRWWFFNRSPFLRPVEGSVAITPTPEGAAKLGPAGWRLRAIEVLRVVLEDDRTDSSSGAAVALGKARARAALPRLVRILGDRREKRERREAAALALGLLGGEEALQALRAQFSNRRESWQCRAFAGIGLGLTGEKEALPSLLATARDGHRELQAAALMGVGLLGDPIAEATLLEMAHDRRGRLDPLVRAAAVHALARIRSREAMPALLSILKTAKRSEIRRAAVQALGRVVGRTDWSALSILVAVAEKDRDAISRRYATIALGRTASTGVVKALTGILEGARMEQRGFAAIALALTARNTADSSLRKSIADNLLVRLDKGRMAPDTRAAVALALGIIGDVRATDAIKPLLRDGWAGSRGHAAVALGLIGDRDVLPELRKAMVKEGSPWVQREIAIALGLFRDEPSIAALGVRVRKGKSELERANAALALGRIATPKATSIMVELLSRGDLSGPTRSKVATALGEALDTKPIPSLYPLTEDFDYDLSLATFHRLLHRL